MLVSWWLCVVIKSAIFPLFYLFLKCAVTDDSHILGVLWSMPFLSRPLPLIVHVLCNSALWSSLWQGLETLRVTTLGIGICQPAPGQQHGEVVRNMLELWASCGGCFQGTHLNLATWSL